MARRCPDPWVPRTFSAWTVKGSTAQRGNGRSVDCWDVKGKADGVVWAKRFRKAGVAQSWRDRLERDFPLGLPLDLRTKQFVAPQVEGAPGVPSVFELTERYYRSHPEWEPATQVAAARSFNRARRWLLAPAAEPSGREAEAVDDFLRSASFLPVHLADQPTETQRAGRDWIEAHSAAADSLSSEQIEAFVGRFTTSSRDGNRPVSPATMVRFLQPLKGCWSWAVGREDIPVERNPWLAVRPRRKVKGKVTMVTGRAGLAVDADMVLSVDQAIALAGACASEGSWAGSSSVSCW